MECFPSIFESWVQFPVLQCGGEKLPSFPQACADLLSTSQDLVRCLGAAHPAPILWDCLVWLDSALWPHHICAQVDAEDGHSAQGKGDIGNDEQQEGGDLRDVAGQGVCDGLLQVVKDEAACEEILRASGTLEETSPPRP